MLLNRRPAPAPPAARKAAGDAVFKTTKELRLFKAQSTMSSKKRKGNLPETSTTHARPTASRNEKLSQPNPKMDDDNGDESSDHSMMRAQLAAALLEIEHLRAAASEPCARCHFYSDWTVRVRTMGGHVYTITCPDGPKTLVAHVKQKLAQFDPKCHILQQVTLVLPCEASSSSCSAESTDAALEDDRTLESYGLLRRDVLDLLLVDMNWSSKCLEAIAFIRCGGQAINFEFDIDDDAALAVSWSLVNAVC
jgi:hypothetical protein